MRNGLASRGAVRLWPQVQVAAFLIAFAIAALVAAPLISFARIAAIGDAEIWAHLAAYVLPVA